MINHRQEVLAGPTGNNLGLILTQQRKSHQRALKSRMISVSRFRSEIPRPESVPTKFVANVENI